MPVNLKKEVMFYINKSPVHQIKEKSCMISVLILLNNF